MWSYEEGSDFTRKKRKWPKKHRREMAAMADNLQTVFHALNCDAKLEDIRNFGFIHSEPGGVLAIDQKGGGAGLKQTRLYVYPDITSSTLFIITIGDKNSQDADIKFCKEYVRTMGEHNNSGESLE